MKPCQFCRLLNAIHASICIGCGTTLVGEPSPENLAEDKTEPADATPGLRSGRPENTAKPLDSPRSQRTDRGYILLKKVGAERFELPDFPAAEVQSFNQNFARSDGTTRTAVYLNAVSGAHAPHAVQNGEIFLVENDGNRSAYVLFAGTNEPTWGSPTLPGNSLEPTSQAISERARELSTC